MAKILIIDDDVELTQNLSVMLTGKGHKVRTLDSADGALGHLLKDMPDVLVLDVMFPDNPAAGFDLARQVRKNRATKKLPIILLTGVNQEFPMDFSSADIDPDWMPVQDFMEKPPDLQALLRKIDKFVAGAPAKKA